MSNGYVMSGNPELYGKLSKQEFTDDSANEDLTTKTFTAKWGEVSLTHSGMCVINEYTTVNSDEMQVIEASKVFPAPALRDMTDKTFASLLGINQFIGGGE